MSLRYLLCLDACCGQQQLLPRRAQQRPRTYVQHEADDGDVHPELAASGRCPAVRAGVAAETNVSRALLGATHLAALQLVADVRLGGHAAQRVVERVELVVALNLVAGQQRVAVLVDGRAVLVHAARADDAGQRRQR